MNTNRIMIIGTSHVAKESKDKIKKAFAEFMPDIIGVELDRQRYYALMNNVKSNLSIMDIKTLGVTGFLFAVIGKFVQKKIGDVVGMNPGEEMLLGANLAKNNKLLLALIDQDVRVTLKNLSKKVKFSEKLKMVGDLFLAPFQKQEKMSFDLNKVPKKELINKLMGLMKNRYPGFYNALVEDRNKYMAKKLFVLLRDNPDKKIMAIVGAGHEEGMYKHLDMLIASNPI
ncbi:TraB/GumN family protein [Candidatus Woesearchaeota archaeon]|nr:TraB/GumN family protein [Candidatus Woesearchaeota archaeon]MCF7901367.1 TraB/GumN family protein [Candidatus Woesearchaeota archaeon]MCF8013367.1 TraB/GumN family protein [Candidatus Woesearchaeota archaeon]